MSMLPPVAPEHLHDDRGPGFAVGSIILGVVAVLAVILRVVSRKIKGLKFQADDYWIFASLPFAVTLAVLTVVAIHFGLGRHMMNLTIPELMNWGKTMLAAEIIWAASLVPIKISILFLYVRIFGTLRYFRIAAYVLSTFTVLWAATVIIVLGLQCRPVELIWNKMVPGTCINQQNFFIGGSTPDVVIDFVILVLPLHAIWKLQKSLMERISLLAIFVLGSLTCIISLVRLIELIITADPDQTWALGLTSVWTTAEACLGIVCACTPTYLPFFRWLFGKKQVGATPQYTPGYYSGPSSKGSTKKETASNYKLQRLGSSDSGTRALRSNDSTLRSYGADYN